MKNKAYSFGFRNEILKLSSADACGVACVPSAVPAIPPMNVNTPNRGPMSAPMPMNIGGGMLKAAMQLGRYYAPQSGGDSNSNKAPADVGLTTIAMPVPETPPVSSIHTLMHMPSAPKDKGYREGFRKEMQKMASVSIPGMGTSSSVTNLGFKNLSTIGGRILMAPQINMPRMPNPNNPRSFGAGLKTILKTNVGGTVKKVKSGTDREAQGMTKAAGDKRKNIAKDVGIAGGLGAGKFIITKTAIPLITGRKITSASPSKYIKGSADYIPWTKELPEYIASKPGKFAAGVGLIGLSVGSSILGAKHFMDKHKDLIKKSSYSLGLRSEIEKLSDFYSDSGPEAKLGPSPKAPNPGVVQKRLAKPAQPMKKIANLSIGDNKEINTKKLGGAIGSGVMTNEVFKNLKREFGDEFKRSSMKEKIIMAPIGLGGLALGAMAGYGLGGLAASSLENMFITNKKPQGEIMNKTATLNDIRAQATIDELEKIAKKGMSEYEKVYKAEGEKIKELKSDYKAKKHEARADYKAKKREAGDAASKEFGRVTDEQESSMNHLTKTYGKEFGRNRLAGVAGAGIGGIGANLLARKFLKVGLPVAVSTLSGAASGLLGGASIMNAINKAKNTNFKKDFNAHSARFEM